VVEDPGRRFVPGSPSGINIWEGLDNFGKGINWDVHGPWVLPFTETDKTMAAIEVGKSGGVLCCKTVIY